MTCLISRNSAVFDFTNFSSSSKSVICYGVVDNFVDVKKRKNCKLLTAKPQYLLKSKGAGVIDSGHVHVVCASLYLFSFVVRATRFFA